ncbi:MAG: RHS repeat domain-containing protein [Terriglobales bacterium]
MFHRPEFEIQNQVLRHRVDIVGTPFSLNYRSDRVPGRRAAYSIMIPLTRKKIPRLLKRILLQVSVCGRTFQEEFPPAAELTHTFVWDGLDVHGRSSSSQLANVRIGYAYARSLVRWNNYAVPVGGWDAKESGIGGWTLSIHHKYDPLAHVLYLGQGFNRRNPKLYSLPDDYLQPEQRNGIDETKAFAISSDDGREFYIFNDHGLHLRTINLMGRIHYCFQYDGATQLTSVQDGYGMVTGIERSGDGVLRSIHGPYGQRTSLSISRDGYPMAITNPGQHVVTFLHSETGLLRNISDPNGFVYRFGYDEQGRLAFFEEPDGAMQRFIGRHDLDSHLVLKVTPMGRESSYLLQRLSAFEERVVNRCCGGREITVQFKKNVLVAVSQSGRAMVAQNQGDASAALPKHMRISTPDGRSAVFDLVREVILTRLQNPLSVKRTTDVIRINGRKYSRIFDVDQRQDVTVSPANRRLSTTLDDYGRIVAIEAAGLAPINIGRDPTGRITNISQGCPRAARSFGIAYDHAGRVAALNDPLGLSVRFSYDECGRVIKQRLADGRELFFGYDHNDRLTSVSSPTRPAHVFEYTPFGALASYTAPGAGGATRITRYTYNADKQLVQIIRPAGPTIDIEYDDAGFLKNVTFAGEQVRYDYDRRTNQLKRIATSSGTAVSHTFDGHLLTKTEWVGIVRGHVSREFDNNFRPTSATVNGTSTTNLEYDADGYLVRVGALVLARTPNGSLERTELGNVTSEYAYNACGELTKLCCKYRDRELLAYGYEHDQMGRITKVVETVNGMSHSYGYVYDLDGRLKEVFRDEVGTASYEYDPNDNRVRFNLSSGDCLAEYDAEDRIVARGPAIYEYTDKGERIKRIVGGKETRYEYDVFGNLVGVSSTYGPTIQYVFDGQNRRIGKKVDGNLATCLLYLDDLRPAAELDGHGSIVSQFFYATKTKKTNVPDYLVRGESTFWIVTDHLGSPRVVVDAKTGNIAQEIDYDELGNILRDTNPGFQPFGFAGGLYDPETGLTHFGARDYDAATGTWIQKDPAPFSDWRMNPYEYAAGDPINVVDPTGQSHWKPFIDFLKWLTGEDGPKPPEAGPPPPPPGPSGGPVGGADPGTPPPEMEPPPGIFVPPGTFNCFPLFIFKPVMDKMRCEPLMGPTPADCPSPTA